MKAQASLKIQMLIKTDPVRVVYSVEAGLDDNGLPQVYLITKGYRNVNVQLVEHGLARYQSNNKPPKRYHGMMVSAERTAKRARRGLWSSGNAADTVTAKPPAAASSKAAGGSDAADGPGGPVYSELNSSQYHSPNCKWTARMNPQRRIKYTGFEAAEKSSKRPCWICLPKRAEEHTFGGKHTKSKSGALQYAPGKGPIFGYKGEFHTPVCPKLKGKQKVVSGYPNKDLARASGSSKPCNFCLRLRYKPPGPGECMGRSPGYWRPCQRKSVGSSGLCLVCQGKK
jgi:hypothetical protein